MSRPPLGSIAFWGIPWYSVLIVSAVVLGILLATREEKRLGLPKDTVLDFVLWAVPFAIVGARLYYVAFRWNVYYEAPMRIFNIREGGLAIYGGLIFGLLAAWIASRKKRVPLPVLLDVCAPSLLLGQAIGRWGNYANMEAYGEAITNPALQFFPLAVEIPINGAWAWHMATFFYESAWCALCFVLLWSCRKKTYRSGDVALWYLLLYGAGRAVIEGLRTDSLKFINHFVRISQVLSVVAILVILLVFARRLRRLRFADWLSVAVALLAAGCGIVSEFERGAYQSLFLVSQGLLLGLVALDLLFILVYFKRTKTWGGPSTAACLVALGTMALLYFGMGRATTNNIAYISLRQALCLLHMLLSCLWLYLRAGAPLPKLHDQEE